MKLDEWKHRRREQLHIWFDPNVLADGSPCEPPHWCVQGAHTFTTDEWSSATPCLTCGATIGEVRVSMGLPAELVMATYLNKQGWP